MNRETELSLIDELLALKANNAAFLDESVARNPTSHYACAERFGKEQKHIFRRVPIIAAHSSELDGPDAFITRGLSGLPVLITRDQSGQVHTFINVCRHRGTRLVDDLEGCKHRFSCPYHAWTYDSTGDLIAAPHFEQGFGEEQKSKLGLSRLECVERYGFIWVLPAENVQLDLDVYLEGIDDDLESLSIDQMAIAECHTETRKANWKILVEGGIEAYHFRVAHRTTIGPHFENNLSSYRQFGPHLRSILPRTSMADLGSEAHDKWRLRDHANVLYTVFPTSQLLVQQDHIVWISQEPISVGETRLRLATLVPQCRLADEAHWKRNHAITTATLLEDFDIGESIQAGVGSGANDSMLFGRFEGALDKFNCTVDRYLNV